MLETALFARIKPSLARWGKYSRIENSVESGTWDTFYTIEGQAGWIETKVEKGGMLYFEKFQPNWARGYLNAGLTNLFVLAALGDKGRMEVYHASTVVEAPLEVYGKWRRVSTEELLPELVMTRPYDWEALRLLLSSPFTLDL